MKTWQCWLALVALCFAAPVAAQTATVAGIVIDDRTEQPIRGVLVYVESQSSVAETDADGRFSLAAPRGRQTIVASVIGYALLRTDVDVAAAPLDMTIRLSEGAGAYTERVTVSGSLRQESDSVPGSTSLYGRELENLRGAVLDDPLRAMQSLAVCHGDRRFLQRVRRSRQPVPLRRAGGRWRADAVPDALGQWHHRRRVRRDDQQRDARQRLAASGQLSAAHRPPVGRRDRPDDAGRQPRRVPRARRLEWHERDVPR